LYIKRLRKHRVVLFTINPNTGSYFERRFLDDNALLSPEQGESTAQHYSEKWSFPVAKWCPRHLIPEHVAAQKLDVSVPQLRRVMKAANVEPYEIAPNTFVYAQYQLKRASQICALELLMLKDAPVASYQGVTSHSPGT